MKQVFYKAVFLIVVTSVVSAFTGTTSNACDEKLFSKNCRPHKQLQPNTTLATSAENNEHLDFILTNSILRF